MKNEAAQAGEREAFEALLSRWEARRHNSIPVDSMIVGKHIRELREVLAALPAVQPATTEAGDVNALAQEIRRVDGSNTMGAGALAEALMPFLSATPVAAVAQPNCPASGHVTVTRTDGSRRCMDCKWSQEKPAAVAQPVADERIIAVWDAWPRQGITSRKTAVEFARAVLALAASPSSERQDVGGDRG